MDTNKKDPQVRYSDEDLEEFKALILEKLDNQSGDLAGQPLWRRAQH